MDSFDRGRLLRPGEVVQEHGPVRCREPDPKRPGRLCLSYVGPPLVGSVLLDVWPADTRIKRCEHGIYALRCSGCGRHYVFAAPRNGNLDGARADG